jgi:glucose/mannose-6-phosphate isomerase
MKQLIHDFPTNMIDSLAIGAASEIRKIIANIDNITICGMGGSGIGGKLVSQWIQHELAIPVLQLNDYNLPAYVKANSLVIASSYSGNTEETMNAVRQAKERGAHIIGVSSGGELLAFCQENNYDYIIVPGGNPPRSALAFSVIQLVTIFVKLGLISSDRLDEVKKAQALLVNDEQEIHAIGKQLAQFLFEKVGIIYSAPEYEGVAVRARQQFNENSKYLAWTSVIPEMNHNELVGWGGGDDRFAPVFLFTEDMDPRNKLRYTITKSIIEKKTGVSFEVIAKGDSLIERSFYLINVVDWASWYLSELRQVDAVEIVSIDFLKGELSKFK